MVQGEEQGEGQQPGPLRAVHVRQAPRGGAEVQDDHHLDPLRPPSHHVLSREEGDPDSHREGSHPPGDDALQAAGLHQVHERRRVSERNTCLCFTSDAYYSWWKCGVVCGSLMKREPLGGCAVSRRDLSRFRGGENIFSSTRRRDGGGARSRVRSEDARRRARVHYGRLARVDASVVTR